MAASTLALATKNSTHLPFYPSSTASCTLQHTVFSTDFMARWHRPHMSNLSANLLEPKVVQWTMEHSTNLDLDFILNLRVSHEKNKSNSYFTLMNQDKQRRCWQQGGFLLRCAPIFLTEPTWVSLLFLFLIEAVTWEGLAVAGNYYPGSKR